MAAGTWQHCLRHLLKRDGRHIVHEVSEQEPENNLTVDRRRGERIRLRRRLTTDSSPWELWCSVTSDRQPHFTSDPAQICSQWVGCIRTTTLLMFHFLFPPWHPLCILFLFPSPTLSHPLLAGPPLFLFISNSLAPSTALALPLTGRAAVDDTYPAEISHSGSMDRRTQRGEIAPQPCPGCVFSVFSFLFVCVCVHVCLCMLVFLSIVHLTEAQLHRWCDSHSMWRHCMCMCVSCFILLLSWAVRSFASTE